MEHACAGVTECELLEVPINPKHNLLKIIYLKRKHVSCKTAATIFLKAAQAAG
jgi:hypothetical protein